MVGDNLTSPQFQLFITTSPLQLPTEIFPKFSIKEYKELCGSKGWGSCGCGSFRYGSGSRVVLDVTDLWWYGHQSVSHLVSQSVSQSVNQSVSQAASQSVSQSVSFKLKQVVTTKADLACHKVVELRLLSSDWI